MISSVLVFNEKMNNFEIKNKSQIQFTIFSYDGFIVVIVKVLHTLESVQ